jgi:hypothetical protein
MAQHHVEAVGVVLDGGGEREASQLRQTRTANGWPELEMAELLEARPGRHPLVLPQTPAAAPPIRQFRRLTPAE